MRVLHLLSSTGFHGSESMAAELLRQLALRDIECHVAVLDNAGRGDRKILDETRSATRERTVFPCARQFDLTTVRAIGSYAAEHRIDIVHSHKYKTTFHALLARRRGAFALLSTYHNWLDGSLALRMYAAIDKRIARYCDATVGVSSVIAAELRRFVPAERVYYIPNGICTDRFAPPESRSAAKRALGFPARPLLGFVGRLTPLKGIDNLLRAAATLANKHDFDVVLVGDGESRAALEQQASQGALRGRVRFLGERSDTAALYQAIDLFILPSLQEAFPMALLEAMSCGVPVIATEVGDVGRILDNGACGRLVAPGNVPQLERAIASALEDDEATARSAATGRRRVMEHFSAARMADSYLRVYESLLPQT